MDPFYIGNTFHGHLRFGTYTLGNNNPHDTDQSVVSNGYNSGQAGKFSPYDGSGYDRGKPAVILSNVYYGNLFVRHCTTVYIRHRGHKSLYCDNLIYWKASFPLVFNTYFPFFIYLVTKYHQCIPTTTTSHTTPLFLPQKKETKTLPTKIPPKSLEDSTPVSPWPYWNSLLLSSRTRYSRTT